MLLDLAKFYTLDWIGLQHSADKVFAVRGNFHWHAIVALLDLHEENSKLLIIERQATADHGVEDNATTPDIDFLPAILLT